MNYQGEWYLIAFCHRRERVLTFAVSRMREVLLLKTGFSIPADFDCKRINGPFGSFGGDLYRVRILFSKKLAPYIEERRWHPSQEIKRLDNGSLILELETSHLFEIRQWVMSWGSGAQVLEPQRLRDDIVRELEESLRNYVRSDDGP